MAKLNHPKSKIILFTSKRLADDSHPIMLRITYQRKRKYFSLNMSSSKTGWDKEKGTFKKNKENNIRVVYYQNRAENILLDMEREDRPFTFDRFEQAFFKTATSVTMFGYLESLIQDLKDKNKHGTAYVYRDAYHALKRFRKEKDLSFYDLDYSMLIRLEKFLAKSNSVNSISVYMRTLRAAFNKAIKEGLVSKEHYPFENYKIKQEETPKRALKQDQIIAFANHETEKGSRMWHSQNFFLFSYLTQGMNFVDIANLKWTENIIEDRIHYIRQKTKKPFSIKIQGKLKELLKYYREEWGNGSDYIFPLLENGLASQTIKNRLKAKLKKVNEDLKLIAEAVGIENNKNITFYVARHTYATVLKRKGVSVGLISDALGHKTESITQTYLDSFENEAMDKANENLL